MTGAIMSKTLASHYNANSGLFTDLYQLTMAASYHEHDMNDEATFELFIRDYPRGRDHFVVAGLEQSLEFLQNFCFSKTDIKYLESLKMFKPEFLKYLKNVKFTGTVEAIPEGEIAFAKEPILSITAPRIEGQLVETFLLNNTSYQTMIATKAERIVKASKGRMVVDFSPRRCHGTDAAMKTARASYISGFAGTSNVLAGRTFDIPVYGTVAHSYVMSFDSELQSYESFVQTFPNNAVLLIDTYDTINGAKLASEIGKSMKKKGKHLKGVRLDSGNIAELSKNVRKILDKANLKKTKIFASGNLDEYKISKMLSLGAKVDAFGVGTELGTSGDAPSLNCAYKLVMSNGTPVMKLSSNKKNIPGRKAIIRTVKNKRYVDTIALKDETKGKNLLQTVMKNGKPIKLPSLESIRKKAINQKITKATIKISKGITEATRKQVKKWS